MLKKTAFWQNINPEHETDKRDTNDSKKEPTIEEKDQQTKIENKNDQIQLVDWN